MDTQSLNSHIAEWKRTSIVYQIAIVLSITVFTLIVVLWIVVEIINVRRRKLLSIERQKDQMDGVKAMQKINEINNNKEKNKLNNKPLLQTVVINNMNKNYRLTRISQDQSIEMTRLNQLEC